MKNKRGSSGHTTKTRPERQQYFNTIKAAPSGETLTEETPSSSTDKIESIVHDKKEINPIPKKRRRSVGIGEKMVKHVKKNLAAYLLTVTVSGIGTIFMIYVHLNREVGELSVSVKNNAAAVKEFKEDMSKLKDMVIGLIKKK